MMTVYVAMAYSGNNGFDLIGTASREEAAWDNVLDWCLANVEGFAADQSGEPAGDWITDVLSDLGAAEEVTVRELSDVSFKIEAAVVTVEADGEVGLTMWADQEAACDRRRELEREFPRDKVYLIETPDGFCGRFDLEG